MKKNIHKMTDLQRRISKRRKYVEDYNREHKAYFSAYRKICDYYKYGVGDTDEIKALQEKFNIKTKYNETSRKQKLM